jgi:hypothetical protein
MSWDMADDFKAVAAVNRLPNHAVGRERSEQRRRQTACPRRHVSEFGAIETVLKRHAGVGAQGLANSLECGTRAVAQRGIDR